MKVVVFEIEDWERAAFQRLEIAARGVREQALCAVRDEVEVVHSELGSTAGILGAATRVWETLGPGRRRA